MVGEVLEGSLVFVGGSEDAGLAVAGKTRAELSEILLGAHGDGGGLLRIVDGELCHGGAESQRIERADREGSVTALGAAGAADQMRAGAAGGVGQGVAYDLKQLLIVLEQVGDWPGLGSPWARIGWALHSVSGAECGTRPCTDANVRKFAGLC